MEKALHDVCMYCDFARIDPGATRLPDESTSCWQLSLGWGLCRPSLDREVRAKPEHRGAD